jgi:acyl-CoA synthetase (AMP-forming)/AMP-acid ligase II
MPKAVRHSHRGLVTASLQRIDAWAFTDEDRIQYFMALFTIFGVLVTTATFAARASMRLFRRFDPAVALRNMADERITFGFAAAPVAVALRDRDDLETYDLSSVRYLMWGATPIVPEIASSFTARTGVRWLGAYATTEIGLTSNPADDPSACRLDTPGFALADTEIRVVDPETGTETRSGETGEIVARSPSVMLGYLPEIDNAGVFFDGGWYRTGDIGWMEPEGWVHVTDRLKEMIKVSGFAVAPAEIERTLFLHPAVADCAVFGVPDAARGEVPKAAVVLAPGATVTASALIDFVADHLATYKHVRHVVFVESIPRNAGGKVLRRVLRDAP